MSEELPMPYIPATGRNLNSEILAKLNVPQATQKHKTHLMILAHLTSNTRIA